MAIKKHNFVIFLITLIKIQSVTATSPSIKIFSVPKHFAGLNESLFNAFEDILKKHKPVNLGIGSPDFKAPDFLRNALATAITSDDYQMSQYTPINGLLRLRKAVAKFYSKLINRTLDADDNVIITIGATEALHVTFLRHTFPGDEWIIIEPAYNYYIYNIIGADGVVRTVPMRPRKTNDIISSGDWTFDRDEMANAFNEKTKGIVINTPHNPLGKVFTYEELSFIADLAKKWNTLVITDEIYEFLTYDHNEHIRMATLPGMFERTITISSASKSFSATGFRVGWIYGPSKLIGFIKELQDLIITACPSANQEAVAVTLEKELEDYGKPNSYLNTFRREMEKKRNYLSKNLMNAGMLPIIPQGGYYVVGNWTTFIDKDNIINETGVYKDYTFIRWMVKNVGIFGLPLSGFYSNVKKALREDSVRFCFAKKDETLKNMKKHLSKWKKQQ